MLYIIYRASDRRERAYIIFVSDRRERDERSEYIYNLIGAR
nr:MAG TPA: hypothetical protein [Caudoviricetes sp.]